MAVLFGTIGNCKIDFRLNSKNNFEIAEFTLSLSPQLVLSLLS